MIEQPDVIARPVVINFLMYYYLSLVFVSKQGNAHSSLHKVKCMIPYSVLGRLALGVRSARWDMSDDDDSLSSVRLKKDTHRPIACKYSNLTHSSFRDLRFHRMNAFIVH